MQNYENNKTFFIPTQTKDKIYRINFGAHSTDIYNFNYSSYSSNNIFTIKKYAKEYFTNFIYCQNINNLIYT